ncbi:MAG TPA: GNAT family N-acetyltransferase [Usitatibacter sp.]|nr:GNAT family N-acetyltransferase [Usitatibacter sp.]
MTISWSHSIEGIDWREMETLYRLAPLGNKSAALLETVYGNSRYCCIVRDADRIVGAGRALADGGDCSYLCDVAILPDYQGRGIGKEIVKRLVELSGGHKKIILYSVPGKEGFYRKLGFLRLLTAMAMFQDREAAIERGHLSAE